MCVKLDGCFRHVIILIQVCKPDNCTWKQLIGQIFISFYLHRHSAEISKNSLWTCALCIFYLHQHQTALRFCTLLWVPIQTLFEVMSPYRFQCPWPVRLLTTPSSFHAAPWGSMALPRSSSSPGPRSDWFVDSVSVVPLTLVLFRPVHKGIEKKGNAGCVFLGLSSGFLHFFFLLEVAVNIDRWGKEQVCICTIRYRNISTGILLYSQFPYP